MPRLNLIQFRRGSWPSWGIENPVLALGEPGIAPASGILTGTILKIGDGVTAWNDLPLVNNDVGDTIIDYANGWVDATGAPHVMRVMRDFHICVLTPVDASDGAAASSGVLGTLPSDPYTPGVTASDGGNSGIAVDRLTGRTGFVRVKPDRSITLTSCDASLLGEWVWAVTYWNAYRDWIDQ